ncbi:MAG: hypothetical protein ACTSP4_00470 [Candidatus Hodarchaeales archaeon]
MPINCEQLKKYIVEPTCKELGMYSESAVNLLLGTAAQESHLGTYIKQIGGGPALSIYQIEPATERDVWDNYMKYHDDIKEKISKFIIIPLSGVDNLIGNLFYATAIARLLYSRHIEALPRADDISGLAIYWKKYYNTEIGAGTIEQFIENYHIYIK